MGYWETEKSWKAKITCGPECKSKWPGIRQKARKLVAGKELLELDKMFKKFNYGR